MLERHQIELKESLQLAQAEYEQQLAQVRQEYEEKLEDLKSQIAAINELRQENLDLKKELDDIRQSHAVVEKELADKLSGEAVETIEQSVQASLEPKKVKFDEEDEAQSKR